MTGPRKLSLLIAGVDGTLGTHEKILTDRARKAVHRLQDKGVRFAITSGRPPVGVSDDLDSVKRCESDAQAALGHHATAARSQPYYLDVTHPDANKGFVAHYLSKTLGVPEEEIATIGDQPNDVLMFKRSGFSIAMGNASGEVKRQASAVTDSYDDEGFAKAVERFLLGASAPEEVSS
jgi:hydroxymethylpyrimidine pyrophosphatase-like HAD family hydrolase